MTPSISIVGMACRYADARSPVELWENVLAERRSFRRMPSERLSLDDYYSPDPNAPDRTYCMQAALLDNYEFDRARFHISGSTYRASDPAHWLALDIASQALADANFSDGPPRESTGVYVGNTLTGEFSRANTLRLRWPYVRRVLSESLAGEGWPADKLAAFLESLEQSYKLPFPAVGEDTLAGGLSNTIAGRISNYFDLKGGCYTVDGACASSLLAVSTACSGLAAGDIDLALAGGVDLSLDPFELIGFAKSRALATGEMRVFDTNSSGFWPGEGCGFVVLMRHVDAMAQGRRIYATIRGWGISSDGGGGISRPEVEGQLLALRRVYARAGFAPSTVSYFEGHGTGTKVGDTTELQVLSRARRQADPAAPPAAIGSVKANIGHTKAAAGIAGLLKAAMAVHTQTLPPTTGCDTPHAELSGESPALRVLRRSEAWPAGQPVRAAASAMGFGGINTHIVLEGDAAPRRPVVLPPSTAQDAELFLFTSPGQIASVSAVAARLSRAELTDVAATLAAEVNPASDFRAAVVASTPEELSSKLADLSGNRPQSRPRIGFLFPGQGSPVYPDGGILFRRFESILDPALRPGVAVQPGIVKTSVAALRVLRLLGIEASVAVGHSLGELTALHWAGALDETAVVDLAAARGRIMSGLAGPRGLMGSIALCAAEMPALINGDAVVMAGLNSPRQTVISGEAGSVERVVARARARGVPAVLLPVAQAFHSPLVEAAADPLAKYLANVDFRPLQRPVLSTITGAALPPHADLRDLLRRQVTAPVRFTEAITAARVDLWIEVGPGRVLSALAADLAGTPAVAIDAGSRSMKGLLEAVAAAFEAGASIDARALFAGRFTRPFHGLPRFLANPCERAATAAPADAAPAPTAPVAHSALDLIRQFIAERTELPQTSIQPDQRLLTDLHLNSITVAQLVADAARRLGVPPPVAHLQFADATVAEVAQVLEATPASAPEERIPSGVDSWVRTFHIEMEAQPLPAARIDRASKEPRPSGSDWHYFTNLRPNLPPQGGVLVSLPPEPDATHISLLLEAARAALAAPRPSYFILVQHGGGAASFARTLHLEATGLTTCVIDLPVDHPRTLEWIAAEAQAAKGYTEVHYDAEGRRYQPVLRPRTQTADAAVQLNSTDVLLVTGGGKGITAECALTLARESGAKLALLGRSHPANDSELAANLDRIAAAGVRLHYVAADVTDTAAIRAAFQEIETTLGPVTAILHGAGSNTPRLISTLDEAAFRATLAPKVDGLRHLLAAADPQRLRLLIAFGSIIARTGLAGEADYAVANEWLARTVDQWRLSHPHCRCLTIDWSVWSGLGMGQRLGRVESLMRQGITPITPEEGVRVLRELMLHETGIAPLVVAGRFGNPPTLKLAGGELPFARFLERPRVHYPGVELIADADLSPATDPYLKDHVFQGTLLLPAVIGMEAMAQAASALADASQSLTFEDVQFSRPVTVSETGVTTVRVAALVRAPGEIEVVLRCSETAFQVDHFRATCRFAAPCRETVGPPPHDHIALDPDADLYGSILFQTGRFRRLRAYHRLTATECVAQIATDTATDWFARYLPGTLLLGDPGARDAVIHAIQACIPHSTVLPIGVDRIVFGSADEAGPRYVHARERRSDGNLLVYDLNVTDAAGTLLERWEGLQLRVVGAAQPKQPWPAALLGPYLARKAGVSMGLGQNGVSRPKRADGKPESNGRTISVSHAGSLVMTASAAGCDMEPVCVRSPEVWRDLLGPERFALSSLIARESQEDAGTAATRVWCAIESLKKAGAMHDRPLTYAGMRPDGWIDLAAGRGRIPTYAGAVGSVENRLAFAVLIEE